MSQDKPWNDVADQLRPAEPDQAGEVIDEEAAVGVDLPADEFADLPEADPADVADQHRVVPLPEDREP